MVTPDALKAFGASVRKARVEAGWTLSQLADEAFENSDRKGFVSQIELGKRQITPLTAGKLAEALALKDDVLDLILKDEPPKDDTTTPEDARAAQLLAETEKEGDPGIGENLLIALAYEYAGTDTTDIRTAHNDLKAALEAAVNMQARAALPDNTGDGVAAVRAEVQRLNNEDGPEAAGDYLDDAITRKSAEMGALLDLGVNQDRIRNDPKGAAQKLLTKLRIEVAANQHFGQLRLVQDEWYERGRDAGLNFDATVAVHLAEHETMIANGTNERGTAQNDLGIALKTLGERESGADRLEQAVTAYQAASEEWTRDKVPLDWAAIQNNLGNALKALGERESRADRLEQAVTAYQAALEERTRDKVPLAWAMTQNNLGNALRTLGQRESGTDRLEQAVTAYQAALEEWKRDKVPLDWAATQNNLGNALQTLGKRESGTGRLELAVTAYQAALEEWTRDKVPFNWALTQENLAILYLSIWQKDHATRWLDKAQDHALAAQEVYLSADAPLYIDKIARLITSINNAKQGGNT